MPDTHHTSPSPFLFHFSSDPQYPAAVSSGLETPTTLEKSCPDSYQLDASPIQWQRFQGRQIRSFGKSRAHKWKGRFSKDDVEVLEAEFQRNKKPCKITKMALAETIQADVTRVNVCATGERTSVSQTFRKVNCRRTGSKIGALVRKA